MRSCNQYQPTGIVSYLLNRAQYARIDDSRACTAKSNNVLFFFMRRSTSSRCWKQAIALARIHNQLAAQGITVVLVGDGRYKAQAQKLVEELNLPFRYIADNGALRRYYNVENNKSPSGEWMIVLVDGKGVIRFCGREITKEHKVGEELWVLSRFLSAEAMQCIGSHGHIMRYIAIEGCGDPGIEIPH